MQGKRLFIFAVLVSSYAYSLFIAGILKILNAEAIYISTIIFSFLLFAAILRHLKIKKMIFLFNKFFYLLFLFLIIALINFIGVLGPELGFDALWYHLTIPKLYIENESIFFIDGGLLYYSAMPKLIDLLYIPALFYADEIFAKFIHFLFGLLTSVVVYKTANIFVNKKLSFLASLIFYSNLVVGWMSITAYIDLGRAFFTSLCIYFFMLFYKSRNMKYFYFSSIIVGFEIATKLLGISTLISILIILLVCFREIRLTDRIKKLLLYIIAPVLIISPWLLFSIINTGTLFYPFFTDIYPSGINFESFNPLLIVKNYINLFLFAADPISPIYIITIPLLISLKDRIPKDLRILLYVFIINLIIWNFIPQKNSRFLLPYLPMASVSVVWVLYTLEKNIQRSLYFFIILTLCLNIVYRGVANIKYLSVILGCETKEVFLEKNLNFKFGDYMDRSNKVSQIVGNERVLIKGIHNLYYINFKFDHDSWGQDNIYRYILVYNDLLRDDKYKLIYSDAVTHTNLYEKN